MENPGDRIIVALDMSNLEALKRLISQLLPYARCFKIGLEFLSHVGGPRAVDEIRLAGGEVFYDGKFCDTPNTVREASRNVSSLGVKMFSIHASMGIEGMKAAREGNESGYNPERVTPQKCHAIKSKILAVTVLTSLDDANSCSIFGAPSKTKVLEFARWSKLSGLDGIVCSPRELELISSFDELNGLLKVTPGVRPNWYESGDQRRVLTPKEAILAGADYLVIGRPITVPENGTSVDAIKRIIEEIAEAMALK